MSNFFVEMPGRREFSALMHDEPYRLAPDDWFVVITDVEGSTAAIQAGNYKTVNMVGAATIAAVVNATGIWELPYVFGGDGSSALVPGEKLEEVRSALARSRRIAERNHGLKLRAGLVPHRDLLAEGAGVRVAKYQLPGGPSLAFFRGSGLSLAESWVKQGRYLIEAAEDGAGEENNPHEGLSCRWAPLTSARGIFLSILVKPLGRDSAVIARLFAELDRILDLDSPDANPVKPTAMVPAGVLAAARMETRFARIQPTILQHLQNIAFVSFLRLLNDGWLRLKSFDLSVYKTSSALSSDFRKFDETLRMVVDCTPEMKAAVSSLLEDFHRQGLIAYGLHPSQTALMTCFVQNHQDRHIHFIDGADGGYAFAARAMKDQLGRPAPGG